MAQLHIRKLVRSTEGNRKVTKVLDEVAYVTCGLNHPRLENECILEEDHEMPHEDAAGNEWIGRPD